MVASVLIILFSLALLIYWFRYSCLLILQAESARDTVDLGSDENEFAYPQVQAAIATASSRADLNKLEHLLERDYRIVENLLREAGGLQLGSMSIESRMLRIDYRLMRAWSALAGLAGLRHARHALQEQLDIVQYLANSVPEQTVSSGGR
jgi:hypothetical protein